MEVFLLRRSAIHLVNKFNLVRCGFVLSHEAWGDFFFVVGVGGVWFGGSFSYGTYGLKIARGKAHT